MNDYPKEFTDYLCDRFGLEWLDYCDEQCYQDTGTGNPKDPVVNVISHDSRLKPCQWPGQDLRSDLPHFPNRSSGESDQRQHRILPVACRSSAGE